MTVLAAAPEYVFAETYPAEITSGYAGTYARQNMRANVGDLVALPITATADVWFHCIYDAGGNAGTLLRLYDGATEVFDLQVNSGTADYGYSIEEAANVLTGVSFTQSEMTLDVHVDLDAGTISIYEDGVSVFSTSVTFTATTVDEVRLYGLGSGTRSVIREIVVADENTRGMRCGTHYPNSAGATQDQSAGTYTDIDEPFIQTSDVVTVSDAAATFTTNSITTDLDLLRVFVAVHAQGTALDLICDGMSETVSITESYANRVAAFDSLGEIGFSGTADVATLAAAVVYGAAAVEGTERADLLAALSGLPVTVVTETGTTLQGDLNGDRADSEFVTGENETVTALTLSWSSGPTAAQQIEAARRLPSPRFALSHG